MKFTVSPNEALRIQRAQMCWYRPLIGRRGIKAIRGRTTLPNSHPDVPISIDIINDHIPRGGSFEGYLGMGNGGRNGGDELAWYDAVINEFV